MPCGVNLDLFQPERKQAARKQLGFDPDDIILLNVGRFEPLKGIDRLLEAMNHLRDYGGFDWSSSAGMVIKPPSHNS